MTKLLPELEEADGIILTGPIYCGSICGQAKCFIDRLYAFFDPSKAGMTKSKKTGKKAAMVFCCGAGEANAYKEQLDYLVKGLAILGAGTLKTEIFGGINGAGEINRHEDYIAKIKEIAVWLEK